MNKVQKIREAVEKLKSQLLRGACSSQVAMETRCKEEAYNEVLTILYTMQEEPVSEELDAASIAYAEAFMKDVNRLEIQQAKWHERHPEEPVIQGGIKACFIFMRNAFMAGAKWQEEKDDEEKVLTYKHGFDDCKEQMMAKAVDSRVYIDAGVYPYIPQMELYDYDKDVPLAKEGDKYKVILIKE